MPESCDLEQADQVCRAVLKQKLNVSKEILLRLKIVT